MGLYSYNSSLPNPPDDPADDVEGMQTNTASIAGIVAVDHVGFNIANKGGYHNQVTFAKNQTAPGIGNGVADIFVNEVDSVSWPFFQNTDVYQLLGPSSLMGSGYITLQAGLILQWGTKTNAGSSGSVTFPLDPFPNNLFVVLLTVYAISSGSANRPCTVTSSTTAGFDYRINSGTGGDSLFWFAIGN